MTFSNNGLDIAQATNAAKATIAAAKVTEAENTRAEVLAQLARLGNLTIGDDTLTYEGSRFVLPETLRGDIGVAIKYLEDYRDQQEATFSFKKSFNYRPYDGANAFQVAMNRVFGTTGVGKSINTFFGPVKPEYMTVQVGPTETIQVPWNRVRLEPLEADFYLQSRAHREFGHVFAITVEAPRKYRAYIEAFFKVIENVLETDSIYRGKAFTGGGEPVFLDTARIDPSKVVYSEEVMIQLETNLWSLLRHTDNMRDNNVPLKRSVLVEGPYGTGKTLAGQLTAKEAVENGWTFIICRTGKDDLNEVLQTAQLYAPAVVWYEDIDIVAEGKSKEQVSTLLDALDGITNKGVAVLAGFTTNHVHNIQKGVLRPGRLDAVIHIGELDDEGFKKLVLATLPARLVGEIDFPEVVRAFNGFLPAFAKEAIDRALRYSISRNKGIPDKINTADLIHAANGLRPQLALMSKAHEGVSRDVISDAFSQIITRTIEGTDVIDGDDDKIGTLRAPALNGAR